VLRAAFDLEDDHGLLVYGVHLKSNWGEAPRNVARRQRAMELIREDVEAWRQTHQGRWEIAVMGDMNVDPEVEQFAEDSSLVPLDDWSDLWLGRPIEERTTIPTRYGDTNMVFPPAAFDRIIVSAELQQEPWVVEEISVLQRGVNIEDIHARPGDDPDNASDHYPVYVDIVR
jgi:endonuclease/exonuclease/phosphatase family metal-dependent hydrolase